MKGIDKLEMGDLNKTTKTSKTLPQTSKNLNEEALRLRITVADKHHLNYKIKLRPDDSDSRTTRNCCVRWLRMETSVLCSSGIKPSREEFTTFLYYRLPNFYNRTRFQCNGLNNERIKYKNFLSLSLR